MIVAGRGRCNAGYRGVTVIPFLALLCSLRIFVIPKGAYRRDLKLLYGTVWKAVRKGLEARED